jgi:hypothetical protein
VPQAFSPALTNLVFAIGAPNSAPIIGRLLRAFSLSILAALVFPHSSPAQDQPAAALAKQIQTDLALLVSHQTLGAWHDTHPTETPEPADYRPANPWPEADFSTLPSRCAISVAHEPSEVTRSALFVVPPVAPGKLPPLPTTANSALLQSCQLEEMWLETHSPVSADSLTRALVSLWGEPNAQGPFWHRAGMTVRVVNRMGSKLPVAVYARNDFPAQKDWYDVVDGFQAKVAEQSAATLAKIAALDPALTKTVLARTTCATRPSAAEDPQRTADRLERWLNASKTLPPARRAAALLIADCYISCSSSEPPTAALKDRYVRMGVDFFGRCPQDGPEYGHNFRKQAQEIDKLGAAGEWAALASFWENCRLAYGNIIEIGEKLARRFPEWRPYIRYALARSHDATLSRFYPGGSPEEGLVGAPASVSPEEMERERTAAIRDFTSFIHERPADSEAPFAWQEVWRLQAGLKPTRVAFGCSCE